MTKEQLKAWFESHECIKPTCIEKAAKIPNRSLTHYLSGNRDSINQAHIDSIEKLLTDSYGYKPNK